MMTTNVTTTEQDDHHYSQITQPPHITSTTTTNHTTNTTTTNTTSNKFETFRNVHIQYRRRQRPGEEIDSDWRRNVVVDVYSQQHNDDQRIERIRLLPTATNSSSSSSSSTTNTDHSNFVAYRLTDYPGCIILPNVLSTSLQLQLAHCAVTQYCDDSPIPQQQQQQQQQPHATNLSSISCSNNNNSNAKNQSLWNEWKQDRQIRRHPQQKQPVHNNKNIKTSVQNNLSHSSFSPSTSTSALSSSTMRLEKLSWSTMGYHYDWTNRSYPPPLEELSSSSSSTPCHYSPMPQELQRIATIVTDATRSYYEQLTKEYHDINKTIDPPSNIDTSYHATACIVNYYNTKSVMGIHRDEIEVALHQPVISISVGCAAIFLFGGTTLDNDSSDNNNDDDVDDESRIHATTLPPLKKQQQQQPIIPILVRSGDVILFGVPNRLNYHSMPRIIPHSCIVDHHHHIWMQRPQQQQSQINIEQIFHDHDEIKIHDPDEMDAVKDYLSNHRINMNLRQVY